MIRELLGLGAALACVAAGWFLVGDYAGCGAAAPTPPATREDVNGDWFVAVPTAYITKTGTC